MAKRKTPKVKDLRPEKISEEQLKKTQQTIKTMEYLQMELGKADIKKYGILKGIENIQTELDLIRQDIKKEYGTDDINVQDGTIRYPENGEVNKKN